MFNIGHSRPSDRPANYFVVRQAVLAPPTRGAIHIKRLALLGLLLLGLGWLVAIPTMFYEAQRVATNQDVAAILQSLITSTAPPLTTKYPLAKKVHALIK